MVREDPIERKVVRNKWIIDPGKNIDQKLVNRKQVNWYFCKYICIFCIFESDSCF